MIISGLLFIHGGEPESKNKCLTLFSATTRLLWQHFLLAWACRSEFDGEVISVCTLPSQVFFSVRVHWSRLHWPVLTSDHFCILNMSASWVHLGKFSLWKSISYHLEFCKSESLCCQTNTWVWLCIHSHTTVIVTPFLPVHLLLGRVEFKQATRHSFLWLFKHISCVFTHISLIQKWGKIG